MIFKEYEKQFNVHPASDLDTYCKLEGVSMSLIRKPDSNKAIAKKLEKVRVGLGNKIIKLGHRITGVPNKGIVS